MGHHVARNVRARQILNLLRVHGPLTAKAISLIIEPPMQKRKLEMALSRLRINKLAHARYERTLNRSCLVYEVPQPMRYRQITANFIGCHAEELLQPYFRYRDVLHNEGCSLLHHKLKKQFQDATFIRDFYLQNKKVIENVLISSNNDRDLKPDLLMHYPKEQYKRNTSIVFELERTQKSSARLAHKITKYSAKSKVDGVVYVCEKNSIANAIRESFENHALHKALRISHYGPHFFLFADAKRIHIDALENVYNFSGEPVCLSSWINILKTTDRAGRHNSIFETGALYRPS